MMPQSQATNTQPQVNNATIGSGTRHNDQTTVTLNVSSQENRMSVQSFQQQSSYKEILWIESGTHVSAMGRSFKMIKES
eukprot:14717272-Ditylum_brightwellii.AAC.1